MINIQTVNWKSVTFVLIAAYYLLAQERIPSETSPEISKFAFGSCLLQKRPQPVWEGVLKVAPQLFVLLGDNIYGDTEDMNILAQKYAQLNTNKGFQKIRDSMDIAAVWDDHDYGMNDAGREYPKKAESKQLFLDFFNEPQNSERRNHAGIYTSYYFGEGNKRVQMILLDTRYFRSPLKKQWSGMGIVRQRHWVYRPDFDPKSTILGKEQWEWLENELKKPARLRLICSSIQVLPFYSRSETWSNVPRERDKLYGLLRKFRTEGVIILSGNIHWSEISLEEPDLLYPIYEFTSSGLNRTARFIQENDKRIGLAVNDHNFGTVDIDWNQDEPLVKLSIHNTSGEVLTDYIIEMSTLKFQK